jgi:hypothetical protein
MASQTIAPNTFTELKARVEALGHELVVDDEAFADPDEVDHYVIDGTKRTIIAICNRPNDLELWLRDHEPRRPRLGLVDPPDERELGTRSNIPCD